MSSLEHNTEKRLAYEEGERNKQIEIAKEMLKNNLTIDIIMKCTNLTRKEIEKLKEKDN